MLLGSTSSKHRINYLAQGNNRVSSVRVNPAALDLTEPRLSNQLPSHCDSWPWVGLCIDKRNYIRPFSRNDICISAYCLSNIFEIWLCIA